MAIRSHANVTDSWVPFNVQDGSNAHPTFRQHFNEDGSFPNGPPPPRTQADPPPAEHELRPGEAYYWVDGELPQPPPPSDPRWNDLRLFLFRTIGAEADSRLRGFAADVWVEPDIGDPEKLSAGAWARDWLVNYWNPPWAVACTPFRRSGWEPWANGHPGGNHYSSAMWALETYLDTLDGRAWDLFVLRTLHLAGQGIDHRSGGQRYEKSSWCFAGDFQQDGYFLWSHTWNDALVWFWRLTGELGEVVTQQGQYTANNPHQWTGYWGIRGTARYLRALRAYDLCLPPHYTADDVRAASIIDSALSHCESRGQAYFENLGKSWATDSNIDVWQAWDFLHEAGAWARNKGNDALYQRLLPFAQWLVANAWDAASRRVAYYAGTAGTANYGHWIYNSHAVPFMAEMVERGDLDQQTLKDCAENVLQNLPNAQGFRGLLWINANGQQTRPWGPAASKSAAQLMGGMRPDALHVAGL